MRGREGRPVGGATGEVVVRRLVVGEGLRDGRDRDLDCRAGLDLDDAVCTVGEVGHAELLDDVEGGRHIAEEGVNAESESGGSESHVVVPFYDYLSISALWAL